MWRCTGVVQDEKGELVAHLELLGFARAIARVALGRRDQQQGNHNGEYHHADQLRYVAHSRRAAAGLDHADLHMECEWVSG